ncbi:MAG: EcsC family protein [Methylovirgula sp.]
MSLFPVMTDHVEAMPPGVMAEADRVLLRRAVGYLEHRSLATRLSQVLGQQLSRFGKLLPANFTEIVDKAAERAIALGLAAAMRSLKTQARQDRRLWHKAAATLSGAAGGAFGLASLPIELPLSTLLMLRSIAAIAGAEGEDLTDPETAFACLQVFALGGQDTEQRLGNPDNIVEPSGLTESGYFAVRAVLAQSVTEAARFVVERGVVEETAPVILRVVSQIATRFGLVVSQKIAAQAVPIIGAAGGAAINYAFIDHFQTLARGHFTVRRLERIYGADLVRAEYDAALREAATTFG